MKLLIVDDEKHVITAIRCLVPHKQLGITEIFSAQTPAMAKTILEKERPEIAVIDIILREQTGMNLLAFILNKGLRTQVIAISGHSDYEYVRTMLLNGAVDYLLKPIEAKPLVESIRKAISRLSHPEPARAPQPMMNMNLSAQYVRTLLRKLLNPEREQTAYAELASLDSQFAGLQHCALFYYDLDYLPVSSEAFLTHLNIFEEKVKSYMALHKCGFFLDMFNSRHERLLLVLDEGDSHRRKIEAIAADAFASIALAFHMGCVCGAEFPGGFRLGFGQAKAAFFADDCQMTPESVQLHPRPGLPVEFKRFPDMERQLLSLIVIQDQPALMKAAAQWLNDSLYGAQLPLGLVRELVEEYNAMYQRWSARIKKVYPSFSSAAADRISYNNFLDEYFSFSRPMMLAAVQQSLRSLAARAAKVCADADVFRQIAFYMELNYDQPFSQAQYAGMFHLNKDYLSRKFKQVFGVGMVTYINRLRIERAEELMRDPSLKIRDIAYRTGFGDVKYFTRQFKALMQITPSEFRAMLQMETEESEE